MDQNEYERMRSFEYDGNLARQLQPSVEPERKRQVVRRKVVRRKNVELLKVRLRLISLIAYVFILGITYTISNSVVTSKQSDLKSMRSELSQIIKANSLIDEQIEEITDLNRIYDIAVNDLGMGKPEAGQVLYVTLTNQSFVENVQVNVNTKRPRFRMSFKR